MWLIFKYSKQMQVNSNLVIYLTLNVWFAQKEKVNVHTELNRKSVLTQKGNNILHKSTALQSTDRWLDLIHELHL